MRGHVQEWTNGWLTRGPRPDLYLSAARRPDEAGGVSLPSCLLSSRSGAADSAFGPGIGGRGVPFIASRAAAIRWTTAGLSSICCTGVTVPMYSSASRNRSGFGGDRRHEAANAAREFIGGRRRLASFAQRHHFAEACAVDRNLRLVPRRDFRFCSPIELFDERAWIVAVRAHRVSKPERVQKPHGQTAARRRIRARPRIGDGDKTGRDRCAVDDEAAVAIGDAAHRQNRSDRLALEPVRVERTRTNRLRPLLLVPQVLQRLVAGGQRRW